MAKYTCTCCGKEHDEWPALGFIAPDDYAQLPEEKKADETYCELTHDFCTVNHPDQTDRFVRGVLFQKITDHCDTLDYGVWTSLSEKSFKDYYDNFNNPEHEAVYFGWLSNDLADYTFESCIPLNVVCAGDGKRPEFIPHESHDHPFVRDYYNGITKAEAERRIADMLAKTTHG
ncbi:DUF2199 domain-containing protein [Chitinophaga sp. Cy-1792]|uniref:DUF2199 domain-containing protein n=1 Tax=Chitinophaga sp. Cy-1792 TaxID=2608339 RepID=UPI00141FCDA6|nr:DUF2199 domain-containing protein [Chitinophaga sp. Cy-1792]NIG56411.1 DUF2199 domain-containing protein [Chitinophaga sp. Cy-1792]